MYKVLTEMCAYVSCHFVTIANTQWSVEEEHYSEFQMLMSIMSYPPCFKVCALLCSRMQEVNCRARLKQQLLFSAVGLSHSCLK